jgi:hypothetical protein
MLARASSSPSYVSSPIIQRSASKAPDACPTTYCRFLTETLDRYQSNTSNTNEQTDDTSVRPSLNPTSDTETKVLLAKIFLEAVRISHTQGHTLIWHTLVLIVRCTACCYVAICANLQVHCIARQSTNQRAGTWHRWLDTGATDATRHQIQEAPSQWLVIVIVPTLCTTSCWCIR